MKFQTLVVLIQRTWQSFGDDNCSQMAPAITYYVLLAVVPLAMFLFGIAGAFALSEDQIGRAETWVEDYLNVAPVDITIVLNDDAASTIDSREGPGAAAEVEAELAEINEMESRSTDQLALAEAIREDEPVTIAGYGLEPDELLVASDSVIGETLESVASASSALSVIGFVTLAFSASIAFMAVRRSLNFVWGVPHRPFAQQRAMEISMLLGLVLLLGASVFTTGLVQVLRELSNGDQLLVSSVGGLAWFALGYLLPWALTFVLVLLAYRYVPNARHSLGDVWLGALIAATAIEVLKYGYAIYIVNFDKYDAVYGALAGVLLFMFLVYMASYVFLLGAEFASEYPRVMRGEYEQTASTTAERKSLPAMALEALRGLFFAKRE